MSKHQVINFGCRLNHFESEGMKEQLEKIETNSKVIVFNTCAVTKEAERQARQSIRKYAKENPEAEIIVTGCAAQVNPEQFIKMPEVNKVLGNEEKLELKQYLTPENTEKAIVNDIMSVKETAFHMISSFEGKARSFIQVQNGCNHRCTFCIIPYGRGNSRSVPIGEIVTQVKLLTSQGYNEVVLTGVDMTDYGSDLPGNPNLGQMTTRLLNLVPNLSRLRLSSVDVAEIDEDLIELLKNNPKLMPHFHISLQAGDNMILKRMKRRHTREQVIEFCDKIRSIRSDATFGADIIAGFPTETDEMFENSLKLISEAGLTHLHVFPYSEREGTPAARIPKQVPKQIRKERARLLREAGEQQLAQTLAKYVSTTQKILIEAGKDSKTENYLPVEINNINSVIQANQIGQIKTVKIIASTPTHLIGEIND